MIKEKKTMLLFYHAGIFDTVLLCMLWYRPDQLAVIQVFLPIVSRFHVGKYAACGAVWVNIRISTDTCVTQIGVVRLILHTHNLLTQHQLSSHFIHSATNKHLADSGI